MVGLTCQKVLSFLHATLMVPTIPRFVPACMFRREVSEKSPEWLYAVLVDWLWECPTELIPNNAQIEEVKGLLVERIDAGDPTIVKLVAECNDFLSY
jgi:hypothetical protein